MDDRLYQPRFSAEQIENLIQILEYVLEDCSEGTLGDELEIDEHSIDEIIGVLREARKLSAA